MKQEKCETFEATRRGGESGVVVVRMAGRVVGVIVE